MTKTTTLLAIYVFLSLNTFYCADTNNKAKAVGLVSQREHMRQQNPQQTWVFFTNPLTKQAEVVAFQGAIMELAGYFTPKGYDKEFPYYQCKKVEPTDFWEKMEKKKSGT